MSFKRLLVTLGILFAVLIFSCNKQKASHDDASDHDSYEWSYEGETSPGALGRTRKKPSNCSGNRQSPVNIIDLNVVEKDGDTAHNTLFYSPKTILTRVRNNGHTIQFDFDRGDSICSRDVHYDLVQIHFHTPSEHTVNGIRYP